MIVASRLTLIVAVACCATNAGAQVRIIRGTVSGDSAPKLLAAAVVEVRGETILDRRDPLRAVTDSAGRYSLVVRGRDSIQLLVRAIGRKPQLVSVRLRDSVTTQDFVMGTGAIRMNEITVTSAENDLIGYCGATPCPNRFTAPSRHLVTGVLVDSATGASLRNGWVTVNAKAFTRPTDSLGRYQLCIERTDRVAITATSVGYYDRQIVIALTDSLVVVPFRLARRTSVGEGDVVYRPERSQLPPVFTAADPIECLVRDKRP